MLLIGIVACGGDVLVTTGELGNLNYTLETSYQMDGLLLNEAKIATGYPQNISASLTMSGWKVVGDDPYLIYHTSSDDVDIVSENLLDGVGVPGFSVSASTEGKYLVESKKQDELIDQIHLDFVKPDEIAVISWVRAPEEEGFSLKEGNNISVEVGSQAAFIPIPKYQGERIVGDLEVEITVQPEGAAVVGYNIESVNEGGVEFNASPSSIYFVQEGDVEIGATDLVNEVTTYQVFTVTGN